MPIGTGNRFQPWNRRSNEVIERELGDKLDLPDPISRFFSLAQTLSRFFIVLEDSFEFFFLSRESYYVCLKINRFGMIEL